MNPNTKRVMKADCRHFMRTAIAASFFHKVIQVSAPMIAAWMIGDMADHLLTLDGESIAAGMPAFLCAVFFQVVIAAVLHLSLNLLLTREGFAYDGFLMEKFIRLPLPVVETMDAGSVMERLEEDSAAFCWNQIRLYAYPGAIIFCAVVFLYSMLSNHCHIVFILTIVGLAALPVVRTAYLGRRQMKLKKEISEYNESRKQKEQELYSARDFAKSYGLDLYFIHRLGTSFASFMKRTGKLQNDISAKTEVLDFLCSYGAQLGAVLIGAALISRNRLTMGSLLGGYLMIPAVKQCIGYIKTIITAVHDEKKYLKRLSFFYSADSESTECHDPVQVLDAKNISFSYPGNENPALHDLNFYMTHRDNYRITGANGSGKSTLVSILAGLYAPQSGSVCSNASLGRLRRSVALQEQDGTIFSGTIWDNLFLAESRRSDAQALLSEMGLEKTIDYETDPEGSNLSPGEKKKILLARALLRNAPFLMLDEPLNHLDEVGKSALIARIAQRKGGLFLISHQDLPPLRIKEYNLF